MTTIEKVFVQIFVQLAQIDLLLAELSNSL